ncbi:MAG: HAD family hydrolase [Candidatus Hodarchaeales archaeon]
MALKGFKIDSVVFSDLGVVITTKKSIIDMYLDALKDVEIDITAEDCLRALQVVNRWMYSRKNAGKFLNEKDEINYRNLLYKEFKIPKKLFNDVEEAIVSHLSDIEIIPVKGVRKTINFLHELKISCGLIANWDETLIEDLKENGLKSGIDIILISAKFGCEKPAIDIFNEFFNRIRQKTKKKARKTHSIMLGSNLLTDIYPAETLEMIPVYFYDKKHSNPFSEPPGNNFKHPVVNDHKEFRELVDKIIHGSRVKENG